MGGNFGCFGDEWGALAISLAALRGGPTPYHHLKAPAIQESILHNNLDSSQ